MKKQILFLHGFLASGNGNKSQYLKNYVKNNFDNYEVLSPDIADELDLSFSSIESFIKNNTENLVAVVGRDAHSGITIGELGADDGLSHGLHFLFSVGHGLQSLWYQL